MITKGTNTKRVIWTIGLLALAAILIWKLKTLSTLILLSSLFAYILNPIVNRLDRLRFINRAAGTTITLFGVLVGFLMVLFVIIPDVIDEFRIFLERLPNLLIRFQARTGPWLEHNFGTQLPLSFAEAIDRFDEDTKQWAMKVIGPATNVAARIFGGTFSVFVGVVSTFMFPLFLFLLLKDFPRIIGALDDLIPEDGKQQIHAVAIEIDKSLSNFLHGQFMVMLVLGTLYSLGYSIVGIPVAIGVGLLTGILCFIPYIGAATGFVLALLLALLQFSGPGTVLGIIVVFGSVQLLDAVFITPKILGGHLGLRPLWIIIALMSGAELFGFLGVLLAVPATAILKVLIGHMVDHYKHSSAYLTDPPISPSVTLPEGHVGATND